MREEKRERDHAGAREVGLHTEEFHGWGIMGRLPMEATVHGQTASRVIAVDTAAVVAGHRTPVVDAGRCSDGGGGAGDGGDRGAARTPRRLSNKINQVCLSMSGR